ncbi:hypothetical protein pb186bvf_003797 [Paramecium bursaria]
MEEKQFRQGNFEKKNKFTRTFRQQALSKIDLENHYGPSYSLDRLTKDYLEANDKIMQLEEEERGQLRKEKILPFHDEIMEQYTKWIKCLKNGGNIHMKCIERCGCCSEYPKYKKDINKKIIYDLIIHNRFTQIQPVLCILQTKQNNYVKKKFVHDFDKQDIKKIQRKLMRYLDFIFTNAFNSIIYLISIHNLQKQLRDANQVSFYLNYSSLIKYIQTLDNQIYQKTQECLESNEKIMYYQLFYNKMRRIELNFVRKKFTFLTMRGSTYFDKWDRKRRDNKYDVAKSLEQIDCFLSFYQQKAQQVILLKQTELLCQYTLFGMSYVIYLAFQMNSQIKYEFLCYETRQYIIEMNFNISIKFQMEEKQFRQGNFEKKNKFKKAEREKAISQIDLDKIEQKFPDMTKEYLDANDKIMQLEEEDRAKLKIEKIDTFQKQVLKQYKKNIKFVKNGRVNLADDYYTNHLKEKHALSKQVLDDFHI